ncbi:hypothetical protein PENTCL1PPCAC_29708, partial [Pristionchus entomophagus]
APRNRNRGPLLHRLREAMYSSLKEAHLVQAEGTKYQPDATLHELFKAINMVAEEDKKTQLEFHQRETLHLAQKLSLLLDRMQGIRLRRITKEELMDLSKNESKTFLSPISRRPISIVMMRTRPQQPPRIVGQESQPSETDTHGHFDEDSFEERDDVKPEDMDLQATPSTVHAQTLADADVKLEEPDEITDPSTSERPLFDPTETTVKEEVKDEELDQPTTSYASHQVILASLIDEDAVKNEEAYEQPGFDKRLQQEMTAKQKALIMGNRVMTPVKPTLLGAALQKAMKRPCDPIDYSPMKSHRGDSELIKGDRFTAHIGATKPLGPLKEDLITKSAVQIKSPRVFAVVPVNRGRMIQCEFCSAGFYERILVDHIMKAHRAEKPHASLISAHMKNTLVRCDDPSCDFSCESKMDRIEHAAIVHTKLFYNWQYDCRLNLPSGSRCPYCTHSVFNVVSLIEHLYKEHPIKMHSRKEIYWCSKCPLIKFTRIYRIYEHWNQCRCNGTIIINQPNGNDTPIVRIRPTIDGRATSIIVNEHQGLLAPI